jgi:hypothetical protein
MAPVFGFLDKFDLGGKQYTYGIMNRLVDKDIPEEKREHIQEKLKDFVSKVLLMNKMLDKSGIQLKDDAAENVNKLLNGNDAVKETQLNNYFKGFKTNEVVVLVKASNQKPVFLPLAFVQRLLMNLIETYMMQFRESESDKRTLGVIDILKCITFFNSYTSFGEALAQKHSVDAENFEKFTYQKPGRTRFFVRFPYVLPDVSSISDGGENFGSLVTELLHSDITEEELEAMAKKDYTGDKLLSSNAVKQIAKSHEMPKLKDDLELKMKTVYKAYADYVNARTAESKTTIEASKIQGDKTYVDKYQLAEPFTLLDTPAKATPDIITTGPETLRLCKILEEHAKLYAVFVAMHIAQLQLYLQQGANGKGARKIIEELKGKVTAIETGKLSDPVSSKATSVRQVLEGLLQNIKKNEEQAAQLLSAAEKDIKTAFDLHLGDNIVNGVINNGIVDTGKHQELKNAIQLGYIKIGANFDDLKREYATLTQPPSDITKQYTALQNLATQFQSDNTSILPHMTEYADIIPLIDKIKAVAEAARLKAEAEAERQRVAAEAERLKAEAEAERLKAAEAERLKAAEAERQRAAEAEAERLRVAKEEEETRQAEEDAARLKATADKAATDKAEADAAAEKAKRKAEAEEFDTYVNKNTAKFDAFKDNLESLSTIFQNDTVKKQALSSIKLVGDAVKAVENAKNYGNDTSYLIVTARDAYEEFDSVKQEIITMLHLKAKEIKHATGALQPGTDSKAAKEVLTEVSYALNNLNNGLFYHFIIKYNKAKRLLETARTGSTATKGKDVSKSGDVYYKKYEPPDDIANDDGTLTEYGKQYFVHVARVYQIALTMALDMSRKPEPGDKVPSILLSDSKPDVIKDHLKTYSREDIITVLGVHRVLLTMLKAKAPKSFEPLAEKLHDIVNRFGRRDDA